MLTCNNSQTRDNFIDRGSEPVAQMNLKVTKRNPIAEQSRIELMDRLKLSFEYLKKDNILSGSFALLLMCP